MGITIGAGALALDLKAAQAPRKAPEVAITMTGGEQVLLSSFKGKLVVLEFLLTTCPHCQRCSTIMQQMYQEFGPKGMQPLGAAINDNAQNLVPGY